MPTDTDTAGLITYQEAAAMLGRQEQTIRVLVHRGKLHAVMPDPQDQRRRLLSRAEVETYAIRTYKRVISAPTPAPSVASSSPSSPSSWAPGIELDISPRMLGAIAGGIALALLLIFLLKEVDDPAMRAILVGAIAGIAVLVITEWRQQGRISEQEARRLQRLASSSQADPAKVDTFVDALEKVIEASGAA